MKLWVPASSLAPLLGLSLTLGATARVPPQEPEAAAKPSAILDGALAFKTRGCAQCHQIRGEGGHKGPDISGVGRRLKKDAIRKQILVGSDAMPAFADALESAEIDALTSYLERLRDKAPRVRPPTAPAPSPKPETLHSLALCHSLRVP